MSDCPLIQHYTLSHLSVIAIQGTDAAAFLQGQITCDVRQIKPQRSSLGAMCLPNGRVIATFRLLHNSDGFLMILSRDLLESVIKRLRMFVLRSKVSLSDASDVWHIAGLIGNGLDAFLQTADLKLPGSKDELYTSESALVSRVSGDATRCLLLFQNQPAWLENTVITNDVLWQSADINNGLPLITAPTSEQFIPQMLNLDLLGAISFEKGCYTGQEIVARTHYLGKAKRRMYRYATTANAAPGDDIYAANPTEAVGTVVNAIDGQLLAVVNCECSDQALRLGNNASHALTLRSIDAYDAK